MKKGYILALSLLTPLTAVTEKTVTREVEINNKSKNKIIVKISCNNDMNKKSQEIMVKPETSKKCSYSCLKNEKCFYACWGPQSGVWYGNMKRFPLNTVKIYIDDLKYNYHTTYKKHGYYDFNEKKIN